jgi:FkbM family methyltransferase
MTDTVAASAGSTGDRIRVRLPGRLRPQSLEFDPAWDSWVLRGVEQRGLTGDDRSSYAVFLACCESSTTGCVFDVGANVGPFSWLSASSGRRTIAFEPVDELRSLLKTIADHNRLSIETSSIAVADHRGTATFYLSDQSDASNSLASGFRRSSKSLEVQVDTLDDLCREHGWVPTVIKIDTESTEPAVVRGAQATIAAHRPWIVCEVLAGRTEQTLAAELEHHGYRYFHINDDFPLRASEVFEGDRTHRRLNWLLAPEQPSDEFWERAAFWYAELGASLPVVPVRRRVQTRVAHVRTMARRRVGRVARRFGLKR